MRVHDIDDTIAAIATSAGEGGIGIVRISGKGSISVADKIFISPAQKKPSEFKTFTIHYGWIKDGNQIIDEVLLSVMRAPRSYTKEDVVEISSHGGVVAMRRVLELVLDSGCRLAEPGEFTKRAFLNGRIDLAQAEAVLDIIRAKTDSALKIGIGQLKGALSSQLHKIRQLLLDVLSGLETAIDFPEEEPSEIDLEKIINKLKDVHSSLGKILENASQARILREGIHVVICGSPNVGKSSLLNALLKEERSIVTPVAGTTRDTIEEIIDIRGIPVRITDTAGILEPRDLVEKKAVQRSRKYIDSADLLLILFDAGRKLSKKDKLLIARLKKKKSIALINKIDLKQKIEKNLIDKSFEQVIEISVKKSKNIGLLEDAIAGLVYKGRVAVPESILVSKSRHIEKLKHAQKVIAEALKSVDNNSLLPVEFIAQDVKEALSCLDEIMGKEFPEDLLDKIFSEFCIGK